MVRRAGDAAASAVLVLVMAGCAAAPRASGGADDPGVPPDFSLDLTVLASSPDDAPPLERCVLFPDGTLHAARGGRAGRGADRLPPFRRTLSHRQVASLWSLCRDLGRPGPGEPTEVGDLAGLRPEEGWTTWLVVVTADGDRWSHRRRVASGEPPDPATMALVRQAAELAWVVGPDAPAAAPIRDFGPDPYARYRR